MQPIHSDISLCYMYIYLDVSLDKGNKSKTEHRMGLYQTKKFCTEKETVNKMKRQPMQWEKIFANDIFHIYLKYIKSHNLTSKKSKYHLKKMGRICE